MASTRDGEIRTRRTRERRWTTANGVATMKSGRRHIGRGRENKKRFCSRMPYIDERVKDENRPLLIVRLYRIRTLVYDRPLR